MSIFNSTKKTVVPSSTHDLSHTQYGTYYPGYIYPIFCDKVVPGDKFKMAAAPFLRSQPFVSPLMSNVRVSFRFFYCRNQLLWKNFDEYITNKPRNASGFPGATTPVGHVHPSFGTVNVGNMTSYDQLAFWDYLYDANQAIIYKDLDALPARMYNRIYSEYYANETVQGSVYFNDSDGNDTPSVNNYKLRLACYKKDYFTSALPNPQFGDPVTLPARVVLDDNTRAQRLSIINSQYGGRFLDANQNLKVLKTDGTNVGSEAYQAGTFTASGSQGTSAVNLDPNGTLGVNVNISDLRKATAMQRFLEKSAVNGNRYAEYILSNFGVYIPDRSAYRPQYLGGGEQLVNFSPVEQNAEGKEPVGTLAGKGVFAGVIGMNREYLFTEHGWLMCLMVIRPDAIYCGGLDRHKVVMGDRFENYYLPAFQNIGMQDIKQFEIQYRDQAVPMNDDVFAYQQRYADYKGKVDRLHGEFAQESMKSWVTRRKFDDTVDRIYFGADFVHVQQNVFANNVAVDNYPPFFGPTRMLIKANRPMQYHARYNL